MILKIQVHIYIYTYTVIYTVYTQLLVISDLQILFVSFFSKVPTLVTRSYTWGTVAPFTILFKKNVGTIQDAQVGYIIPSKSLPA